ncbi:MAG: tetratricopeptide repeat protein [Rhodospirillales bacterium]
MQAEGRLGDAKSAEQRLAGWMANHPTDKQGLDLQIKALTAAGDTNGAIAAAEAAHAGDPSDADITQTLAKLYMTNRMNDKAVALLDRAEGAPNPVIAALRGQALALSGRDGDARKAFQQSEELAPGALAPRFGLIELAIRAKDYTEARTIIDSSLRVAPGEPRLLQALVAVDLRENGIKSALGTAEKLKQDPQNMPAALLLPGSALAASGDQKGAADAYLAAFREAPSSQLAAAAASALAKANRQKEAEALLASWVPNSPKDVTALQVLASYALNDHRWDDAGKLLKQIMVLDPNNPVALNNAAWAVLHSGRHNGRAGLCAACVLPGAKPRDRGHAGLDAGTQRPDRDGADAAAAGRGGEADLGNSISLRRRAAGRGARKGRARGAAACVGGCQAVR